MLCQYVSHKDSSIPYFLLLLTSIFSIFACSTQSGNLQKPEFKFVEATLAKGINVDGNKYVLLNPTNSFSTQDSVVVSHVKFENLAMKHEVKWEWYDPDERLYHATKGHLLRTSKGKYVQNTATWHKISIKGDLAQKYPGTWKVKIFLDNNLIATKDFEIVPDISAISYDVDHKIPVTSMNNPDAVAVIIGNRNYNHPDMPEVKYAHNDASIMKKYLIQTLGFKEGNIIYATDATKARFEVIFGIVGNHKGMLYEYVKPNKSDVFIYYSGHGAPDIDTGLGFFIPTDCDPGKIAFNGYSLDVFYENLEKIETRKLTVVLDSCFSGGTNTGQWLIKGASPALISVKNPTIDQPNTTILSSAASDQISSWYDDMKHGLFTYFLLRAISGVADKDNNNEITIQEIYDFVSDRAEGVPYWAKRLHNGRTQTPILQSIDKEIVIVAY